jgi:Predicted membrane protein (DUF2232)
VAKNPGILPMPQRIGIAIGAGLAAALLFAVTAKGTMLAFLLAYLAPLPIIIVSLGWGVDIGGLAALFAGAAVGGAMEPLSGALFFVTIALPAWIVSFLAILPRERFWSPAPAGAQVWTPVGAIVALCALIGSALGVAGLVSLIVVYGGYAQGVEALAAELTPDMSQAFDEVLALPAGYNVEQFATLIVRISPAAIAASTLLMLCANLYIGARSVQLSHRLKRPWPNLPESFALAPALGIVLIAALALSFVLSAPISQIAWIVAGVLGATYMLQGLAVLHCLSRPLPARIPLLIGLYLGSLITARWSLPILAAVGLLESLLSLRARRAAASIKPRT